MKNLKISHQLIGLVLMMMAAFAAMTFYQVRASVNAIYSERYELLRTQVETAISIMQSYYDREKSGELAPDEARKQAFAMVETIKYEPSGFIFGYDYNSITILHYNHSMVGLPQRGQPDKRGNFFREEIVKKGLGGGGVTTYYWDKPGMPSDQSFEKASYSRVFEPWKVIVATGLYTDDLNAQIRSNILQVVGGFLAVFLCALAAAVVVIRNITRRLAAVRGALEAVASEDVAIAIPFADMPNEIGMMARATRSLQDKVRERHTFAAREESQRQELETERQQNLAAQQQEGAAQAHVVSTIGRSLELLAAGDLTVRCEDLGPRYETLRDNFNAAIGQLAVAMSKVNLKGIEIDGTKQEIRRAATELSQRTERQAADIEETSAALDQLGVAVQQAATGAHDAAQRVNSVRQEAGRSDLIVSEAIEAMNTIERSSGEISKIIGVIDEIAFQTNLLALNAGVEAARAGDSGKGFAVVAQEVRELAQRSASAAKEIKEQILRSSVQVKNGVRLVGEAGHALKTISEQVQTASDIVGQIAKSASEQDTTLRAISSALSQADANIQKNAVMAEETTASVEVLAANTDELLGLIQAFRLDDSDTHPVARLSNLASRMRAV